MGDTSSIPSENLSASVGTIDIPRLYQTELFEEAKKRNIIIRADTGTGKTFVALKLIAWTALQPKPSPDHQIQAFLVPTRPLVHQQADFVKSRSNLRVKAYTGELQPEFWKIEKWHSELNSVDVFVSTPQIFYDLISKGYWKLENVSLLIFDEAHHCRKNHVYNQIMRTHYHRLAQGPTSRLPKILGLTASPIWDYRNLQQAENDIRTLQSALAAQLYEVKKKVEDISKYNSKPKEIAVYFEPSPAFKPLDEPPWDRIDYLIDMHGDAKLRASFACIYSELGIYAYKQSIVDWLQSLLALAIPRQFITSLLVDPSHQEEIRQVIEKIKEVLPTGDLPQNELSPKVLALNQILIDYKLKEADKRKFQCIVFVQRRLHAQLLATLLKCNSQLKGFIRPTALTGHGGNDCGNVGPHMDSKRQNKTVQKLRTGEFNLAVATSVAEEGLDFRTCRVVIRFDELTTWKGYIQSRGRARARDSDYVVMFQTGGGAKYSTFLGKEEELKAMIYRRSESELIEDGELDSTPQLICRLADEKDSILTYSAALGLLNDVCQLIPSDEYLPSPKPEFECHELGEDFIYKLTLPPMAALLPSQRMFMGEPMPSKIEAKRSVAFEACKVLRQLGVINEHLLPHRENQVHQVVDANGRKIENIELPERIEAIVPNAYGNLWTSSEIWIHKLSFQDDNPSGFSTIALLCGRCLRFPDNLYLYDHLASSKPLLVKMEAAHKMQWTQPVARTNLKKLETFTRIVIQTSINRKGYDGELIFLVAPLIGNTLEIDWSLVEEPIFPLSKFEDLSRYPCIIAPLRQLRSRIVDSFELCRDLSGSSPPCLLPAYRNMRSFTKRLSYFKNLAHFYQVAYDLKDTNCEPLVYLQMSFEPANNLSGSEPLPIEPFKTLLPLSTCRGTHIPRSDWNVYSYLPSLTRILHDGCQMVALFDKLGLTGIHTPLAIKALTPPGVEVPWDYQTLETVGDAFLKLATSVHCYLTYLMKGEGSMSFLRSRSTDNDYLRHKALQAGLPGYILSQRFRVKDFRDAQTEDGKALESGDFSRKVPRRVLSDVVEALLGAGYLSGDVALGLKVGMTLDLCFGGTTPWSQRPLKVRFGNDTKAVLSPSEAAKCEQIERKINYTFTRKLILVQALTHRSANSFLTNCYEREEWLGDAVIDMWIVDHAHKRFANVTAEELTLARNKVVNNGSLGFLALRKLGLQDFISHNSSTFSKACREAIEAVKPFQKNSDFFSNVDNLFVVFHPPKILNDVLEAIVGAVFVDSGFNLQATYQVLDLIFEDVIPGLPHLVAHDPLSRLLILANKFQCTQLVRKPSKITEVNPACDDESPITTRICQIVFHGEEIAVGRHTSYNVAEQRASLEALKVLGGSNSTEDQASNPFWSKCQCKSNAAAAIQERNKKTSPTAEEEEQQGAPQTDEQEQLDFSQKEEQEEQGSIETEEQEEQGSIETEEQEEQGSIQAEEQKQQGSIQTQEQK